MSEAGAARRHGFGAALIVLAAVFWSTAGLFVRALPLDAITMMGWRALFAAICLAAIAVAQSGGRLLAPWRGLGWPGLAAIPVGLLSMGSYVFALKFTTVANVMIVYATVPFVAAGVAFLWIGERASARVLGASLIALLGIAVMAGGSLRTDDVLGNAMAFLMTTTFAVQLVMSRRWPALRMAPINAAAAIGLALLCWPFMDRAIPALPDLALLAVFALVTTALAYLLFLAGGRHIPSGEAGLIGLLDVVLGPLWVWLAFAEQPGPAALAGGALVLAAVVFYGVGRLRAR